MINANTMLKTKHEKHISNSSFLLVSTRFCFLLLFLLFSFSAVTLKQINIHKLTTVSGGFYKCMAVSPSFHTPQNLLCGIMACGRLMTWPDEHAKLSEQ